MIEKKNKAMIVYFIYYLAYSSIYIARMNFSVVSALFESAGTLNKTQVGLIGSIFSFAYAAAKIPGGYIGDRKPAQKVIVFGLLVTALSNLLIGFFPAFYSIAILWGLNAIGQSMLWGPTLRNVNHYFTGEKAKVMCQFLSSSVAVGSILGLLVAGMCSTAFGVAACFFIPGVITMLMALIIRVAVPGWKESAQRAGQKEAKQQGHQGVTASKEGLTGAKEAQQGSKRQSVRSFLCDRSFHEMILPAISHGMIKDNVNVWLAVYFVDTFGIDLNAIVYYIFFIPLFGLVGRIIYPIVYKVIKNDYMMSILAFVLCILLLVPLCTPVVTPIVAMLCLGMISAMVSVINIHMLSMFPSRYARSGNVSLAASFMDVLTYGGAGLGSLFFGALIQKLGYISMFLVWVMVSVVSIVCLALARKRHLKKSEM